MKSTVAVALLLAIVGPAASCGSRHLQPTIVPANGMSGPASTAAGSGSTGGISGVVGRVFIEGGPISMSASPTPRPWPNKAIKVIGAEGKVVAKARTTASGRFFVALGPGVYKIQTADAHPMTFVVRAGKVTRLTVEIPVP